MYVCGITPYDATHLGHAATYLTFDLVNRVWRDAGHDGALRAERHRHRRPAAGARRRTPARTGWCSPSGRSRCSARTWRRCGSCRRTTTSARSSRSRRSPTRSRRCSTSGAAYHVGRGRLLRDRGAGNFGYESGYDRDTMLTLFAERGGDPEPPRQARPARPAAVARARAGEPSWDTAARARAGPAGTSSARSSRSNRLGMRIDVQGGGNDLIFPHHEHSAAHAEALTGEAPFAAALRARRHDRAGRREDEQVAGQPGVRLPAARRRRRPDGAAAGAARRALPRRPRVDRRPAAAPPRRGWPAGGAAASRGRPVRRPTVWSRRCARCLADDLDTVGAIAAVDRWADRPDGTDPAAPALVRDLVDALLGIEL